MAVVCLMYGCGACENPWKLYGCRGMSWLVSVSRRPVVGSTVAMMGVR